MKRVRLLTALLLLAPTSSAWSEGLMPIGGLYYDNINNVGVTLGAANLTEQHDWSEFGYYADLTYNRHARLVTLGYASTAEFGFDRGGVAFMQVIDAGRHQNYLGLSFTFSLMVSLKMALFSQVGNPADLRPMLAMGVGF